MVEKNFSYYGNKFLTKLPQEVAHIAKFNFFKITQKSVS